MLTELDRLFEDSLDRGEVSTKLPDGTDLSHMVFEGRRLPCIDYRNSNLAGSTFIDCDLRGSIFSDANMQGARLIRCHIYGCDFPEGKSAPLFEECCFYLYWQPSKKGTDSKILALIER